MTAPYDVYSVEFDNPINIEDDSWCQFIEADEENVMFIQAHTFGIRIVRVIGPTILVPWHNVVVVKEDKDER